MKKFFFIITPLLISGLSFARGPLTPTEACVLKKLGWKIENPLPAQPKRPQKSACHFNSPEMAHAEGSLILTQPLPEEDVLLSDQSLCAFKMKYREKLIEVTEKLRELKVKNQFQFFAVKDLKGEHKRGPQNCSLPYPSWQTSDSCQRANPSSSLSEAMSSIYSGEAVADCWVAMQLAAYGTIEKLFGKTAERYFPGSIALEQVSFKSEGKYSPNPIGINQRLTDNELKRWAELGPNAIVGLMGAASAKFGGRVRDPHYVNENLIVVDVPKGKQDPTRSISGAGSLSRGLSGNASIGGIQVYGHPMVSNQTLGDMGKTLRNMGSSYLFSAYSLHANTVVFKAYVEKLKDECGR